MMLERIYISLWGIYVIAFGLFFAGGMLSAGVDVVFGFVLIGMLLMGMIGVLPHFATHHKTPLKH